MPDPIFALLFGVLGVLAIRFAFFAATGAIQTGPEGGDSGGFFGGGDCDGGDGDGGCD